MLLLFSWWIVYDVSVAVRVLLRCLNIYTGSLAHDNVKAMTIFLLQISLPSHTHLIGHSNQKEKTKLKLNAQTLYKLELESELTFERRLVWAKITNGIKRKLDYL